MIQQARMRPEQGWEDGREKRDSGTNRQNLVSAGPRRIIPKTT